MAKRIRAVDLFAGAGGFSSGLARACAARGVPLFLTAVNHWPRAVETHAANHPSASHHCAAVESLEPTKAVGGKIDVLLASPACQHHSTARGGKPMDDQARATGWAVLSWVEQLRPAAVLVENVKEWQSWGPLGADRRPLRSKKGETFQAWCKALESMGYRVQRRVLNAADHGAATTRERLFVQAVRGRMPFRWPEPTHCKEPAAGLFGPGLPRWRAAREIIDWSLKGTSIAGRRKPLSPNTLRRIAAGLLRYGGEAFVACLKGTGRDQLPGTAQDASKPLGTLTGGGENYALAEPYIVPVNYGEREGQAARTHDIGKPMPTATGTVGHALCEPFVMQMSQSGGNGKRMRAASEPMPTITTADDFAHIHPVPFLLGQQSGAVARPVSEPAPTVSAAGAISLLEPYIVEFYATGGPRPVSSPLGTATTRDRFGLVEPLPGDRLDVLFRMLAPHELAAAMGFPAGYVFKGTRADAVRMVGNAVQVDMADALCGAVLDGIVGRAA